MIGVGESLKINVDRAFALDNIMLAKRVSGRKSSNQQGHEKTINKLSIDIISVAAYEGRQEPDN